MRSSGDRLIGLIKWLIILAFLITVILAVLPLRWYYDSISDHLRPLVLRDVSGSLVKGSAGTLRFDALPLGQAEWLLYPGSLTGIGGRLRIFQQQYDLTFQLKNINAKQQQFKKVNGFLDWSVIQPFLQIRNGQFAGYWQFDLNRVSMQKKQGLQHMEGQVTLKDFKLLQPAQMDLGEVIIDFKTQKEGIIVGNISSKSQAVNVSGALYLQPNRWQLNLDIIPRAGYYQLSTALQGVGDPRPGGGRKLNRAGFIN